MLTCTFLATNLGSIAAVWVEETTQGNDDICRDQQTTFEVITPSIQNQEVDDEGSHKESHGFKDVEVKGHLFVHHPAKDHNEWGDEDC